MKRVWVYAGVVALSLGFFWVLSRGKPEPRYKGVRVSYWIRTTQGRQLEVALAQAGPDAIPYLIGFLEKRENAFSKAYAWTWRKLPLSLQQRLAAYRPVPIYQARLSALQCLRDFGPEAKQALPFLKRIAIADPDLMAKSLARLAMAEVGRYDPAVRGFLLAELQNTNDTMRFQAAACIYQCRLQLSEAVPLLVQNITNAGRRKPFNEFLALGTIGPAAGAALPFVLQALSDSEMQGNALTALDGIGSPPPSAIPALLDIIRHGQPVLRPAAVEALMLMGTNATPALPSLEELERDGDPVVRVLATASTGQIKQVPELAAARLAQDFTNTEVRGELWSVRNRLEGPEILRSIGLSHRQTAAWLLGDIGPPARAAVPALKEALNSQNPWLPTIAARALYKITGEPQQALPGLVASLSQADDETCFLAIFVLSEMGTNAQPAIPALERLETRNLKIRSATMDALRKIRSP